MPGRIPSSLLLPRPRAGNIARHHLAVSSVALSPSARRRLYATWYEKTPRNMTSMGGPSSHLQAAKSQEVSQKATPQKAKPPKEARPSASVVLLSPTNQVLLLHRVKTSRAFPAAHVFPGGNLSAFHDGELGPPDSPARHQDGPVYRRGAIRETFEESGILLARDKNGAGLVNLSAADRDAARKAIYANEIVFLDWLHSVGGVADTENLLPFTRWVTPAAIPNRFTTQMYIYMLPMSTPVAEDPVLRAAQTEANVPTPDGSEVMTSVFEDAATWLQKKDSGDIVLFPPQAFLLHIVGQFCTGPPEGSACSDPTAHYQAQRDSLVRFLNTVPTATHPKAVAHPSSRVPWADKVISPKAAMVLDDGRIVLSLVDPGPELKGTARAGDFERVVLVKFDTGPRDVEIRNRVEVEEEHRKKKETLPKL